MIGVSPSQRGLCVQYETVAQVKIKQQVIGHLSMQLTNTVLLDLWSISLLFSPFLPPHFSRVFGLLLFQLVCLLFSPLVCLLVSLLFSPLLTARLSLVSSFLSPPPPCSPLSPLFPTLFSVSSLGTRTYGTLGVATGVILKMNTAPVDFSQVSHCKAFGICGDSSPVGEAH